MITAVEPELCRAGGRGEAAWLTRVAEASRPGPFGINEPAGHPASRGPLMSPGFWLHHAALAWRQVFDRRLNLTPGGRELTRRGIRIAIDLDGEMLGPGGDPLRETLQRIAAKARAAS
jgi:hypothetical protein